MEAASQLKQPSTPQALVAIPPLRGYQADISWLAVEEVNQQESGTEAPQHGPRLTFLPNLQAALKSHMNSIHKLGYADSKAGCYSYYQSLLPHVHKGISNAFWSTSKLSLQMKHDIFHYRTGSLFNQKVRLKCPPALSVHSVSKQIVLSKFSQGVDVQSSRV